MLLTHKKWGGLYDFNSETKELTKVLKCYKENDKVYFFRANYAYYPVSYKKAVESDIEEHKNNYFNDNGEQVFK